jgi:hypothetical protein
LSLRSLDIAVDFDQVECAEGFTYPEEM